MTNFEAFHRVISSSIKFLFLKSEPMQVSAGEETQAAAASNNLEGHKIRVYSCLQNENLKEEDACNKGAIKVSR